MGPASTLLTSTILLALAAAGGLVTAGIRFAGDRSPPVVLAMLHGFLAAAAITLLLYAAATVGLPGMALLALALFFSRCRWRRDSEPELSLEAVAIAQVARRRIMLAPRLRASGCCWRQPG